MDGVTSDVYNLNMKQWTLGTYPKMQKKRSGHKGWIYQGKIYCMGGDSTGTVETFDLASYKLNPNEEWKISNTLNYKPSTRSKKPQMKNFSYSQTSVIVDDDPSEKENTIYDPDYVIFGLDNYRKIVKIKVTNNTYKMEAVDPPLNISLLGYMGGCKVGDRLYFIAGGVDVDEVDYWEECISL